MGNNADVPARVVTDYRAPFPDPISAHAGDKVSIDESTKTDCPGWVWCTNQPGKGGWVPETYLDRQGDCGYLLCDYDAIELTVQVGEVLTCHKEESGFTWATNRAGQSGWVPSSHVELERTPKPRARGFRLKPKKSAGIYP